MIDMRPQRERALLLGVLLPGVRQEVLEEQMRELEELTRTAGGEVVAVKALSEEQLTAELALCPLSDLDLIALGREPAAGCPHAEDIVLDRQFDRVGIHARQVEMNPELVATTVCVHRDLPNWILASHLLTYPLELAERLESHQHGWDSFL